MQVQAQLKLIFAILLIEFIFLFPFFYINSINYGYDEVIVYNVATQGIYNLLDTVKSEPHPPLFYIVIGFLNKHGFSSGAIRLVFLSSYYLLISAGIYWYRDVIAKNRFTWGVLAFVLSFTFIEISTIVRQEVLSIPIGILLILFTYKNLQSKFNKFSKRSYFFMSALLLIEFFLGYIHYFYVAAFVFSSILFSRKYRILLVSIGMQLVFIITYAGFYGFEQYITNQGRFTWHTYLYNSLYASVSSVFFGVFIPRLNSIANDIVFILFIILFGLWSKRYLQNFSQITKKANVLMILAIFISVGILFRGFVRSRYILIPIFILFLEFGSVLPFYFKNWAGQIYKKFPSAQQIYPKVIVIGAILIMLGNSLLFINMKKYGQKRSMEYLSDFKSLPSEKSYYIVDMESLRGHAIYIEYLKDTRNVLPLNIIVPGNPKDQFTKELLRTEAALTSNKITKEEIYPYFKNYPNSNFLVVYPDITSKFTDLYRQILFENCEDVAETQKNWFIFENCNFN